MKRTIFPVIFVFLISGLLSFYFPWWIVWPSGVLAGLFWPYPSRTAIAAFWGAFALWFFTAALADQHNEGILSAKVGQIFKGLNSVHLLLITGLIGGLAAASGAWLGAQIHRAFVKVN
jgi:hypothetical protein